MRFGSGAGFSTHSSTNSPIMHMMRSASVKIHSGHSSQISWGSHFLHPAAMCHLCGLRHGGLGFVAEEAHELHLDHARVVAGLDAEDALEDDFFDEGFF